MSRAATLAGPQHVGNHQHGHGQDAAKVSLGFWIYLMTDCVLFATLFATYAVLQGNTFGGPGAKELFSLPFVLVETLILLTSSFTSGLILVALQARKRQLVLLWLGVTMALGAAFLSMELYEFNELIHEGNSWQRSGFLSAFFTLVGTHGLHIATGLLWAAVLGFMIIRRGLTPMAGKRLILFGLFWHFLDIVWIFIFTFVYLMGAL
ncbi:cytochrome o ubiquinol oxidase subunit III [Candidatus Saccharibacteria bacterium]|nr:cytochrome o ubiquinol oxidase subunit III [Candidatus Saccharibacteria bacterium]